MNGDHKNIIAIDEKLFADRRQLVNLWQEIAENFNPAMANFTTGRNLGRDFCSTMTTSAPVLVHRELSGMLSGVLQPYGKEWFEYDSGEYGDLSFEAVAYMEERTQILRNVMYDPVANFRRASRERFDSIASFGNAVTSCVMNWGKQALFFETHHLRDCVWEESWDRDIIRVSRKYKMSIQNLNNLFKGNISPKLKRVLEKEPLREIECRHCFLTIENLDDERKKYKSLHYDCENSFVMEEIETYVPYYDVARWKTIPGTQYAYSPATYAALADARLVQDMMLVLLEAGQKAVDPVTIAVMEAIRSDMGLSSGSVIAIDSDYDERTGEAVRTLPQDFSGVRIGMEMIEMVNEAIYKAHFLDKFNLPPVGEGGLSPFEMSQRVSEYVRNGLATIDPLEESNNGICTLADAVASANLMFGSPRSIPPDLADKDFPFKFRNPLIEASEKIKGSMLQEAIGIISQVMPIYPDAAKIIEGDIAIRSSLDGIGLPRDWFRSPEEVQAMKDQEQQQMEMQNLMAQLQQGGDIAQSVGKGAQELQAIGNI